MRSNHLYEAVGSPGGYRGNCGKRPAHGLKFLLGGLSPARRYFAVLQVGEDLLARALTEPQPREQEVPKREERGKRSREPHWGTRVPQVCSRTSTNPSRRSS